MMYIKYMVQYGYESLHMFHDKKTGLKAIICIHDSTLGPALGGARLYNYESEEEAVLDCLRLARGMTFKSAAANLKLGGGKAVLIGDPKKVKSEEYFKAFGRFVESLGGKYITAEDMNTTTTDMSFINMTTKYVTGLNNTSGDPSPITALGAYYGIKASVKEKFGTDDLSERTFAIQGVGSTGKEVLRLLYQDGAKKIYYADPNLDNVAYISKNYPNTQYVELKDIYQCDVDVFVPCAIGGIINENTLEVLKASVIAGTANNVLLDEVKDSQRIKEKGILYAPDFIINAGGIINVYHEFIGYNRKEVLKDVHKIYDRLLEIYSIANKHNITTHSAAMTYAQNIIDKEK
ncbi:MAG TPA: Glu/Leu/Phe/Val dehydrogenase [Acholeplasma sp.]|nr:Glu/Leu/Phe/Val dehydrogenase [Acholeplasma sp.]